MCGRFAIAHIVGFWSRFAVIDRNAVLKPRFNVAPSQMIPIVVSGSENKALMMRWGLIPFWAKDPKIGNRLINARSETVATKPAFRTSFKRKRCIVPATGFYEWRRSGKGKVPYYAHLKDDSFFAFAGLYDRWTDANGREILTFTIITTTPNRLMEKIHNRMPVILKQSDESLWLTKEPLSDSVAAKLLSPYPARDMESFEVSTGVNNPANDSEDLIRPV